MTVAGQKNHYNVKLLKGYGVSINLKDNRLCLKGGHDPFTGEHDAEECRDFLDAEKGHSSLHFQENLGLF